jgi:flagellar protein FlaG
MIIQHTSPTAPAVQADSRVNGSIPARAITEPTPTTWPAPQPVSPEALKGAVATLNHAMRQSNQSLEFSVDANTQRTVVKMVDTSTGELIRQFPSETILAISRGIDQFQHGLLLTNKA